MIKSIKTHIEQCAPLYVAIAIFFYIIFFSWLNFIKYENFNYNALDLAIINQIFYNSSIGNFFASSIHAPTYLADHFSPILFLLLPFYALFKYPLTLLVLQNIALAFAAWPIYLIARMHFSKNASLCISLAWLLTPFVQNLSAFEFSFLPFALVFIFFAFYCYLKRAFAPFLVCIIFALFAREDVALFIFMFGMLSLIERRPMKWIVTPCVLSALYFIFAMKFIGIFRPGEESYKFFIYYSWLGSNWLDVIASAFLHPIILLKRFFGINNIEMVLGFLLPFTFLPILSPKYLLLSLLIYAQLFLGAPGTSSLILNTQYSTLFLPSLFIAFIFSLKKLNEKRSYIQSHFLSLFIKEPLGILIVAVALIYSSLMLGHGIGIINKNLGFSNNPINSFKQSLISRIPKNSAVAASYDFLAPVSTRKKVYALNYFFIGQEQLSTSPYILPRDTEYMLVNFSDFIAYELQYKNHFLYKDNFLTGSKRVRKRIETDNFHVIKIFDDIALLQKNAGSNIELYEIFPPATKIEHSIDKSIGGIISVLGYNLEKFESHILPVSLYWKAQQDIEKNYYLNFQLKDSSNNVVYEKLYPMAYGIFPTSEWKKDQVIKTNHWFYIPASIKNGDYSINVELYELMDGSIVLDQDLSTKNTIIKKERLGEPVEIGRIQF